jgi:hypothetical protein
MTITNRASGNFWSTRDIAGVVTEIPKEIPKEIPRLCINCKHVGTNTSHTSNLYKCFAPQNESKINLVDGYNIYQIPYCEEQRTSISPKSCTADGNWFEEAPPKVAEVYTPTTKFTKSAKLDLSDLLGM